MLNDDDFEDATQVYDGECPMSAAKQLQTVESAPITPMAMLDRAVSTGAGIETIEKLMNLQERWEKNQAKKAFDNAISAAKAEIPVIVKNREVDFTSAKGRTHYRHEDLAGIARIVDPILTKHGLSYRYRTQVGEGGVVTLTCIVSHRDGHSEENGLSASRDETGNKNNLQAVGSTITYLQRYTLKAALGLAASSDDDAKTSDVTPITAAQDEEIKALIVSVGADIQKFLTAFQIESVSELPARRFEEAKTRLNRFAKGAK